MKALRLTFPYIKLYIYLYQRHFITDLELTRRGQRISTSTRHSRTLEKSIPDADRMPFGGNKRLAIVGDAALDLALVMLDDQKLQNESRSTKDQLTTTEKPLDGYAKGPNN